MAYTFEEGKNWTDEEFERIFLDSEEALQQTFKGTNRDAYREHIRLTISRSNFFCVSREDGYLLALYLGKKVDSRLEWNFALIGRDIRGSKSHIYNQDWSDAFAAFYRSEGINEVISSAMTDSPLDKYENVIQPRDASRSNATASSVTENVRGRDINFKIVKLN